MEKKQKKEYAKIIIFSILILLFAISIVFTSPISSGIKNALYKAKIKVSSDDLVVHFIDVGQGDAIAIQMPNDKIMMIDSGTKDSQNYLVAYIRDEVLKSKQSLVIDYLILTHSDLDHSGGICALFANFEIKNFYRPNIASESENIGDFALKSSSNEYNEAIKSSCAEQGLTTNVINKEFEFSIGEVLVKIFPPVKAYSTTNDMSSVTKISYLGKSFLSNISFSLSS